MFLFPSIAVSSCLLLFPSHLLVFPPGHQLFLSSYHRFPPTTSVFFPSCHCFPFSYQVILPAFVFLPSTSINVSFPPATSILFTCTTRSCFPSYINRFLLLSWLHLIIIPTVSFSSAFFSVRFMFYCILLEIHRFTSSRRYAGGVMRCGCGRLCGRKFLVSSCFDRLIHNRDLFFASISICCCCKLPVVVLCCVGVCSVCVIYLQLFAGLVSCYYHYYYWY